MAALAMHGEDIAAVTAVILLWAGLHALQRRRRRRGRGGAPLTG